MPTARGRPGPEGQPGPAGERGLRLLGPPAEQRPAGGLPALRPDHRLAAHPAEGPGGAAAAGRGAGRGPEKQPATGPLRPGGGAASCVLMSEFIFQAKLVLNFSSTSSMLVVWFAVLLCEVYVPPSYSLTHFTLTQRSLLHRRGPLPRPGIQNVSQPDLVRGTVKECMNPDTWTAPSAFRQVLLLCHLTLPLGAFLLSLF